MKLFYLFLTLSLVGFFTDTQSVMSSESTDLLTIEGGALVRCDPNAIHVKVPSSVCHIKQGAFQDCSNLEDVTIESAESIEEGAFIDCPKLKKVKLGDNIVFFKDSVFLKCPNLEKLTLPPRCILFDSENLKKGSPNLTFQCSLYAKTFPELIQKFKVLRGKQNELIKRPTLLQMDSDDRAYCTFGYASLNYYKYNLMPVFEVEGVTLPTKEEFISDVKKITEDDTFQYLLRYTPLNENGDDQDFQMDIKTYNNLMNRLFNSYPRVVDALINPNFLRYIQAYENDFFDEIQPEDQKAFLEMYFNPDSFRDPRCFIENLLYILEAARGLCFLIRNCVGLTNKDLFQVDRFKDAILPFFIEKRLGKLLNSFPGIIQKVQNILNERENVRERCHEIVQDLVKYDSQIVPTLLDSRILPWIKKAGNFGQFVCLLAIIVHYFSGYPFADFIEQLKVLDSQTVGKLEQMVHPFTYQDVMYTFDVKSLIDFQRFYKDSRFKGILDVQYRPDLERLNCLSRTLFPIGLTAQINPSGGDDIFTLHSLADLIRLDAINDFITYVNTNNIDPNFKFSTLLGSSISLIDYAAFCGATNIFNYLYLQHAEITEDAVIFCLLSQNTELIHFCEDNKLIHFAKNERMNYKIAKFCSEMPCKMINDYLRNNYSPIEKWSGCIRDCL